MPQLQLRRLKMPKDMSTLSIPPISQDLERSTMPISVPSTISPTSVTGSHRQMSHSKLSKLPKPPPLTIPEILLPEPHLISSVRVELRQVVLLSEENMNVQRGRKM